MYVGFMRNFLKPTKMAELIALISKNYGIDVMYMRPVDINMKTGTVKGKVLDVDKWIEKEIGIPPFIDISPYCFKRKNKEVIDYLRENTFLSDNRLNTMSKGKLQEKLLEDEKFRSLAIPTHRIKVFDDILNYLDDYEKVVLKPLGGQRGQGVYILSKNNNQFELGVKTETSLLHKQELEEFYKESIESKRYILQKYITSRTKQGDPFDCRVHVEKNGQGKWTIARNYIRIGIGQTVISNVNQGGGIADPIPFLKANFGEKWNEINQKLESLATTIPKKIEELRGTHIMSLGMDVGIDRDGELYLFEVNGAPATGALKSEFAYLRSNYYRYVLKEILKIKETPKRKQSNKNTVSKEKYDKVEKERDYYKKEYLKMKKSSSWRFSKPIRVLGSFIKNDKKN